MEQWRKINEHPQYEVSNQNGFRNTKRKSQPKGRIDHWGYRRIGLGKGKERMYHILVAKAFPEICGEWFEGCAVHHRNGDKLDNRPENLQILTKEEHHKIHYQEAPDTFTTSTAKRAKAISKALKGRECVNHLERPVSQYTKDMVFVKTYPTITKAAEENNCDISNISKVLRGKMRTAYGFVWQYAV